MRLQLIPQPPANAPQGTAIYWSGLTYYCKVDETWYIFTTPNWEEVHLIKSNLDALAARIDKLPPLARYQSIHEPLDQTHFFWSHE